MKIVVRTFTLACLFLLTTFTIHAQTVPDHVKVIVGTQLSNANTYIADAEGYFAAQNIEIEFIQVATTSDISPFTLLLQGDIDVFQGAWTPGYFNALTRGETFKAVGITAYNDPDTCPFSGFVVAPGKAADFKVEDLRGTHVAVPKGIAEYYFAKFIAGSGLTADDVTLENVPSEARADAVLNGSISLTWFNQPLLSVVQDEQGLEMVSTVANLVPNASQGVLLFGKTIMERDDDLGVRFMTAYLQGTRQFLEGPTPRNIEILSPILEVEPEELADGCWIAMRADASIDTDTVQDYQNWLSEQDQLDAVVPVEDYYDPSFAREAFARLADIPVVEATAEAGG